MRNKVMLPLLFLGILTTADAQISFQKFYGGAGGEVGISAQQTSDGGYIIGGHNMGITAAFINILLIKTDVNDDTLWTKTVGGMGHDQLSSLKQTMDGGFIFTGNTNSFGAGSNDIYLVKTDTSGIPSWSKTFGGANAEYGNCVHQNTDGGFIIAGNSESFPGFDSDMMLIRTDSAGNPLWTKIIGGLENDYSSAVQQTNDGGFIVCGTTRIFGTVRDDIMIVKMDINGDSLWTKIYGGIENESANYIQQTNDGGYIVCGTTWSFGAGQFDIYVIKTDSSGNIVWDRTYGGIDSDMVHKVQQVADGGYLLLGSTESFGSGMTDVYLLKIDPNGNLIWDKTFGGAANDYGYSLQSTSDGGCMIAGTTESFGSGYYDIYLIKCDSLGNSDCNMGNPATIVNTASTQQTIQPISETVPATIVTNPATVVGIHNFINISCTLSGTGEIAPDPSFSLFPNPSQKTFTISFEKPIIGGEIRVTNSFGQTVYYEHGNNMLKKEIKIENFASGMYFVEVSADGKKIVKKLVKE